jgi:hypothetical protein
MRTILTPRRIVIGILFGCILATASSCKKKSSDDSTPSTPTIVSGDAKFITDGVFKGAIQSVDSSTWSLNFNSSLASSVTLKPNDILVSTVGNGLLRRIESVTQSGNCIVLQTSQATLADLLKQCDISFKQDLKVSQIKSIKYFYPGISLTTGPVKSGNSALMNWDFNTPIGSMVTLTGNFELNQAFVFQLQASLTKGLTKIKFGLEGSETFNVELVAGKEFTLSKEITLVTVNFTPIIIPVNFPPFAIVVTPVFDIKLGVDGAAKATISTSLSQSFSMDAGVQYTFEKGWESYESYTKSFEYSPPSLTTSAEAVAYLKPELNMMIYNVAGPYINAKGYSRIEADPQLTPWWKLYYGIKMSGGAKVAILNVFMADFTVDDLLAWEQLVGQAEAVPEVSTSPVTGITENSATCGGNVTSDGGYPVTARGVCWSTSSLPDISGSHSTDGSGTGGYTSQITGLAKNTPYYVRAYATNQKGTGYGEVKTFTTGGATSLDGLWTNGSLILTLSGSSGVFTQIVSGPWVQVLQAGFISIGSEKISDISLTSPGTYSCHELWWHSTGGVIDGVAFSADGGIVLAETGQTFDLTSSNPWTGIGAMTTFTRIRN